MNDGKIMIMRRKVDVVPTTMSIYPFEEMVWSDVQLTIPQSPRREAVSQTCLVPSAGHS